jgi:hypothetical protein
VDRRVAGGRAEREDERREAGGQRGGEQQLAAGRDAAEIGEAYGS